MNPLREWGMPLAGPLDTRPQGLDAREARAMLAAAVEDLPLGDYDRRLLAWESGNWDQPTTAVLASILWRARHTPVPS